jgi:hypothetical protein
MPQFDHDFASESMERLAALPADRKPNWGEMTPADLPTHLATTVAYSMGRLGRFEDRATFKTRYVFKPLLLRGLVKFPRNIKVPRRNNSEPAPTKTYDTESLHALLEEYLNLIQADEIDPPPHPLLGAFTIDEWGAFHCRHFEHHFTQFGI